MVWEVLVNGEFARCGDGMSYGRTVDEHEREVLTLQKS